ncbi:MAG: AAA family ATPase [Eubacteriales bacterium]|nr:AAA family ATPase [Eubacteriales bacterium]
MRFIELKIDGFGKFTDLNIKFKPGINIIFGRNEAGKSTLHTFLRAMLFGIDQRPGRSGKKALYERLEPWDNPERYKGSLTVKHKGEKYRIERDFSISPKNLRIFRVSDEKEIEDPKKLLKEMLCGLTETGYINTISIGQLGATTEKSMAEEIKRYISNLNTSGSSELNAAAAIEYLNEQKAFINQNYQPDAVKAYAGTIGKIKNLEAILSKPENENKILKYTGERDRLKNEIVELEIRKDELQDSIQKGEKILFENNFKNVAAIENFREEVKHKYDEYIIIKKKAEQKYRKYVPILLIILAAAFSGIALYRSGSSEFLIFGIPAAVLTLISVVMFTFSKKISKKYVIKKKELSDIFSEQLGNEAIDENSCSNLDERLNGFVKLCKAIEESSKEKENIDEQLIKLSRKQNVCQEDIERQQEIRFAVEQNLMQLNALKNQAEELKYIIAENNRIKEKTDAMEIAAEKIMSLSKSIRNSMGIYMNKEAGRLISEITGRAYESIDIDENMSVFLNKNGRMIPVEQVSSGTIDQVYLALRLSAVRLIEGKEDVLPLIFDDSFVLYDDERLRHAISFISSEYKGQILIFTCHHREENALYDEEKGFNLVKLAD